LRWGLLHTHYVMTKQASALSTPRQHNGQLQLPMQRPFTDLSRREAWHVNSEQLDSLGHSVASSAVDISGSSVVSGYFTAQGKIKIAVELCLLGLGQLKFP